MRLKKEHNHIPDFGSVKAMKLLANAKKRCLDEPFVLPAVVTQEVFSNADNEALVALPREKSLKAAMRKLRRRDNPRLPASLEELDEIPHEYQFIDDERWLLHDARNAHGRFIIFAKSSTIETMARSRM